MFVIVPNVLSDAINAAIDKALLDCPEAAGEREIFYSQLLGYYNEHGVIPPFTIGKNPQSALAEGENAG